jgi:hypothetical protein
VYIVEAAHNPEVAGSNPAPATAKGPGNRAFLSGAHRFGLCICKHSAPTTSAFPSVNRSREEVSVLGDDRRNVVAVT